MKERHEWFDEYRNIRFSISKFEMGGKDAWAYYLYLNFVQLPDDIKERFWLEPEPTSFKSMPVTYSYYSEPLIYDLDWHGGCTYYEKRQNPDVPANRLVKIGCDYQHYWDEGHFYNIDVVLSEAKHTIDVLREKIPNLLKWCSYCGDYYYSDPETKWCPACMEKHAKED